MQFQSFFFFFKNKVFNSYKNKKNSPESGFKDLSFFIFSFFSELPVFCWSLNTTHQRHLFDGESVFGVVCGIEKYYVTSGNKEMKGPSFFTALLRDEANCFISLRFPAALQLVADLQIPPSLTATFYTPFLEIDGSLICLCGCFLILNLEMIFFFQEKFLSKALSISWPLVWRAAMQSIGSAQQQSMFPAVVDHEYLREAGISESGSVGGHSIELQPKGQACASLW